MDLRGTGDGGSRSWHSLLWHPWVAALRAEAAVLARDPGAARHLAQAKAHADRNPFPGAPGQRAKALPPAYDLVVDSEPSRPNRT